MSKVKITDRLIKAMKQLAQTSYWQIVCEDFIIPKMEELESIYDAKDMIDKAKTDYELRSEILANIKAYGKMDMIINAINKYSNQVDSEGDNNME